MEYYSLLLILNELDIRQNKAESDRTACYITLQMKTEANLKIIGHYPTSITRMIVHVCATVKERKLYF